MKKRDDTAFEVRLGRIRSASGHARVTGFFKSVGRKAARASSNKRSYRQTRRSPSAARNFARRVLVKVHIQQMAGDGANAQSQHLKYIERDSAARENEPGRLYNEKSDEVDRAVFEAAGKDDRHHFRVIISPEDGMALSDLRAFTRDLVGEMEKDLGTKLEWVGADHYDTGQPHTHLIIRGRRDDGQDLVIPKKYVAHGIRGRAQELVERELGLVTEREGRVRLARSAQQERLTDIDRGLFARAEDGVVDFASGVNQGAVWRRQLEKIRLQNLQKMGLVQNLGGGKWRFDADAASALKRMGERGDIIKAMHRAMRETGQARRVDSGSMFDPSSEAAHPVTGKIISKGIADDVNDKGFIVIDALEGKAVYVDIGKSERLSQFSMNQIVTVNPPSLKPRASDHTTDAIADKHNGRYSPALHMKNDPSAKPEFVQAHLRRLEALRRAGHVMRSSDGSWALPKDYLERAAQYERSTALSRPVAIETGSRLNVSQMTSAIGATWLDNHLMEHEDIQAPRGFAGDVETARSVRRRFLFNQGLIERLDSPVSKNTLEQLKARDLSAAGQQLSHELGKAYAEPPQSGRVSGVYSKAIDRPSGRFAVIERSKDFTLVPWREVMDRNLGKSISGLVRGNQISWALNKNRGISI